MATLATNVGNLATRIATEAKSLRTLINGNALDNSSLVTTAKSNLVAAINELAAEIDALSGSAAGIDDGVTGTTTTWSSQKTSDEIVAAAAAIIVPELTDLINDTAASASTVYSSTKTDAQIAAAVAGLIDGAPGALDTLNELAAALGDNASYAASITSALALKAPLASPALTGTPTAPTAAGATNTTQVATTAFVQAAAPAASETAAGKVELATSAEVIAGADAVRAVTPAGLLAAVGDTATNFVTTFETGLT